MKILEIIPVFFPAKVFGGVVKIVHDISKELAQKGHQVTVYSTNALDHIQNFATKHPKYKLDGFEVCYFNNTFRFDGIYVSKSMISALKKNINTFDLVHLHSWRQPQDILIKEILKRSSVPYLVQAHGSLHRFSTKKRLKLFYDKAFGYSLLRGASKVIAFTQMEVLQYCSMGVPLEKIELIPNGIDLLEYTHLPPEGCFMRKFGIDSNEKILLYLGRINRTKGLDFLVNSFAVLKKRGISNLRLVIVGPDDGYLPKIKSLINSLGISKSVSLTGVISEADKIAAYKDSFICVYLSKFEPYGLVTLEALASGLSVIVAKGTPMAGVIENNKLGFSVNYGDINELASIIQNALSNPDLIRDMGNAGRKFVFKKYSISHMVFKLEEVYKNIRKTHCPNTNKVPMLKTSRN